MTTKQKATATSAAAPQRKVQARRGGRRKGPNPAKVVKLSDAERAQLERRADAFRHATRVEGGDVFLPLDPDAVRLAAIRTLLNLFSEGKGALVREFRLPDGVAGFTKRLPIERAFAAAVLRGEDPWSIESITEEGLTTTLGRFVWLAMGATSEAWEHAYFDEA